MILIRTTTATKLLHRIIELWQGKTDTVFCPRNEVTPIVAKMDAFGNLISNQDQLKSLYVETYQDRLKHRPMKQGFSYLRELKDFLFSERYELAKLRKSDAWTEENLLSVLKSLKLRKSADPSRFINHLF